MLTKWFLSMPSSKAKLSILLSILHCTTRTCTCTCTCRSLTAMVEHVGDDESVSVVLVLTCGVLFRDVVVSSAYVSVHDPQDYGYY